MGNKFSKIIHWWSVHFSWGEEERILCPHASPFRALEITASVGTGSSPPGEQWLLLKAKMEVLFLPLCVILGKSLFLVGLSFLISKIGNGLPYLKVSFHSEVPRCKNDEKTVWWCIKQSTDGQPSVTSGTQPACPWITAGGWMLKPGCFFQSQTTSLQEKHNQSYSSKQGGGCDRAWRREMGHTPRPFLLPHGWHTSITLGVPSPWATPEPPFLTRSFHFFSDH